VNARSDQNDDYRGKRVVVEDHQVPWKYPWPEYAPRAFNHSSVIANGPDMPDGHKWADAADPSLIREELEQRITYQVSHLSKSSGGGGGGTSATPVVASSPAGGRGSPTQPPSPTSPTSPTSPPLPAFEVGDRVRHKDRGVGIVGELLYDGRMPVVFEEGDTHRYHAHSLHKFALVEKVPKFVPEESSGFLRRRGAVLGGGLPLGQAVQFDEATGAPLNPLGRTGLTGRGLLGKWGPNHAADPIVTRWEPLTGHLQVLAILRKDAHEWALPGCIVPPASPSPPRRSRPS